MNLFVLDMLLVMRWWVRLLNSKGIKQTLKRFDRRALGTWNNYVHANRGKKKSMHHHRGTPLFFLGLSPDPEVTEQKKKSYGVYHFPGKTREKGKDTI